MSSRAGVIRRHQMCVCVCVCAGDTQDGDGDGMGCTLAVLAQPLPRELLLLKGLRVEERECMLARLLPTLPSALLPPAWWDASSPSCAASHGAEPTSVNHQDGGKGWRGGFLSRGTDGEGRTHFLS